MFKGLIPKLALAVAVMGIMLVMALAAGLFVTGRLGWVSAEMSDRIIDNANLGRYAISGSLGAAPSVDGRDYNITVDAGQVTHAISPYIYGVSAANEEWMTQAGVTINNWGGNPSTRYNWEVGNAWNASRDWQYRNGNYGNTKQDGNAADNFIREAREVGAEVRLSIPTLGWVAANDENDVCSFPLENGECGDGYESNCDNQIVVTDPTLANVPSDVPFIRRWMQHIIETHGYDGVKIIAMDNEPELWGYTHYDVHPNCTTYQEILQQYIDYSTMVREEMPDVELAGPTTCCWHYYWDSAAGRRDKWDNGNQDFLPWFLDRMYEYDVSTGKRHLDILDIHYYPSSGIFNQDVSDRVSATRLRAPNALWDRNYRVESWIRDEIYLIPRMQELIDKHYPGTKFGLSEWNFGAEESINGALAIADTLGIFGREDLYFATYWTHPAIETPGFYAFKIFGNYDDKGSRFGDTSIVAESENHERVSTYASLNSETGNMHVMLINKLPTTATNISLDIAGFDAQETAFIYRYSSADPMNIKESTMRGENGDFDFQLPAYSISHIVLRPKR